MIERDFENPVLGAVYLLMDDNNKENHGNTGCIGCQLVYRNNGFTPVNRDRCSYFKKTCFEMKDLETDELPSDWFLKQISGFGCEITGRPMVVGDL